MNEEPYNKVLLNILGLGHLYADPNAEDNDDSQD